jgi:RNA 3'-terminal phosphate cyclase (ATP)
MIEIDGSFGEGGGQIIRTALALAAVTNESVHITKIRSGRPNPGLQAQHLEAINAMRVLCDANVDGAKLHATEITFMPNEITGGEISVKIPTAGSVGLVLQPIMIAATRASNPVTIAIDGGATNGKWAMPANYAKHVLLPLLEKMNYHGTIAVDRYGYYPRGGAKLSAKIKPAELKAIDLTERGDILSIDGISHASSQLKSKLVAERQASAADKTIEENISINASVKVAYGETASIGSAIDIFAKTKNSVIGSGALGEPAKKAEDVGKEAARNLMSALKTQACVDEYAEDQLLPYMALAGSGELRVHKLTNHTLTNIWVIEKFLPVKFFVDEKEKIISCRSI